MVSAVAMAIPAKPIKKTIKLSDGTVREVVLRGDENIHFYQDAEGLKYMGSEQSGFRLVDSKQIATTWTEKLDARNVARAARAPRKATWGSEKNPISGSKRGIIILANFADKKMTSAHDNAFFNNYFNQVGFNKESHVGSVHDYFYDQSYGKFDLTFDVVGPVTVSKNLKYYGANDEDGNDMYPATMISEAVKLADQQGVNFSKYDWDGDGKVDQVYVIYAGYGEAAGGADNTIWPHEYELSACAEWGDGSGAIKVDGVTVDTYACSSELAGNSGSKVNGIGTACHEFSHCMAIPDIYDTNNANCGMGMLDLMDGGSYNGPNNDGEVPCGYTSYERMYCGWLTPTELKSAGSVKDMKSIGGTKSGNTFTNIPTAYIIYNDKNRNEYYLLENRQTSDRWFQYGYAHGLLVIHVDFSSSAWKENSINTDSKHQRMVPIAADNKYDTDSFNSDSGIQGKTFPGTKKKTELTDSSTPAATLYNANTSGKKLMSKPITKITETGGTISFDFMGGGATIGGETGGDNGGDNGGGTSGGDNGGGTSGGDNGGGTSGGDTGNTDIATLKQEIATLKTEMASMKKDLETVKSDLATLKQELTYYRVGDLNKDGRTDIDDVAYLLGMKEYSSDASALALLTDDTAITLTEITEKYGNVEYYTLDGTKVSTPTKSGVYIVKKNGETKVIIVKK